jgi:hypothetical protein
MTIDEIHTLAEAKYAILKTDCRLTRNLKKAAKVDYIKKLMVKYGLIVEENKVNAKV